MDLEVRMMAVVGRRDGEREGASESVVVTEGLVDIFKYRELAVEERR